jgi:GT2 family glycosyltransferase
LLIIPNELQQNEWENDERIRVIASGRVGPAAKRDLALNIGSGELLVFFDDDSFPRNDYFEGVEEIFKDPTIAAIGGPALTPETDSFFQKVSGSVFLSRLTGGNPERYLPVGARKFVDDWPSVNFIIKRDVFRKIGGFDSPYWPGEDTHLCLKIINAGLKILYKPDLIVWHHRRSGLLRHIRQVGAYGLHRGYFARHMPETSRRIKYFMPSIVPIQLLSLFLLPFTPVVIDRLLQLGVLIYLAVLFGGTFDIMRKSNPAIALISIPFVVSTHVSYGINFIKGFLRRTELVSKLR